MVAVIKEMYMEPGFLLALLFESLLIAALAAALKNNAYKRKRPWSKRKSNRHAIRAGGKHRHT